MQKENQNHNLNSNTKSNSNLKKNKNNKSYDDDDEAITMFHALTWTDLAWKQVKENTIKNCFAKCKCPVDFHDDEAESNILNPLLNLASRLNLADIDENYFINFDKRTSSSDTTERTGDDLIEEIIENVREEQKEIETIKIENDDENENEN